MDLLVMLGRTLAFSFACGINLYATVMILGLAQHFRWAALPEQFAVFDMDFHLAVAKASGNSIIHRSIEMLKALYTVWLGNFIAVHGNMKSDRFHHQIFEAIQAQDADKAREVMTEHLSDVLHKVRLDAARKPRAVRAKKRMPDG